jgi:hypothetical protein
MKKRPGKKRVPEYPERAAISDLRIHDLRRTLARRQGESGASAEVIQRTLAHVGDSETMKMHDKPTAQELADSRSKFPKPSEALEKSYLSPAENRLREIFLKKTCAAWKPSPGRSMSGHALRAHQGLLAIANLRAMISGSREFEARAALEACRVVCAVHAAGRAHGYDLDTLRFFASIGNLRARAKLAKVEAQLERDKNIVLAFQKIKRRGDGKWSDTEITRKVAVKLRLGVEAARTVKNALRKFDSLHSGPSLLSPKRP